MNEVGKYLFMKIEIRGMSASKIRKSISVTKIHHKAGATTFTDNYENLRLRMMSAMGERTPLPISFDRK